MNKSRQQILSRWLRQQRFHARRWLLLSSLLGLINALAIVAQAWILASLLHQLIVEQQPRNMLVHEFIALPGCFILRALICWLRERTGYLAGQSIRRQLRNSILDKLNVLGPAWIQGKSAGSWATLLLEQIEDLQDYYSRYLPQMSLAVLIPCFILIALFPINWAAGLILLVTAPLIPLFMALVGMGAADANRRNFQALARLSGDFLDKLRGMEVIRLFHQGKAETASIVSTSEEFRSRTMEVLRLAFLSSAVLEFFASISIAVVAVYFGFSYLGELNFGHYGGPVTLFAGFLTLILAPEFFQPLRDLGTFYHAKAQATGAADDLQSFLDADPEVLTVPSTRVWLTDDDQITILARDLVITSHDGIALAGPLNFQITPGQRIAIVGQSGSGKTSLINALLGFLPYQGCLHINGVELSSLKRDSWHRHVAWVGQNPHLPFPYLRENLQTTAEVTEAQLQHAISLTGVDELLSQLGNGLDSYIGDQADQLSVGQAQRVAITRAILKPAKLLLLDEPGASLDRDSEQRINQALEYTSRQQTTLLITHQLDQLASWDEVWVMRDGKIEQQGSYAELCDTEGSWKELFTEYREQK